MSINKYKLLLVIFFPVVLFSFKFGSIPYFHSEARYVEVPRGMIDRNDFITPRINGIKYFEKPPLMYWLGSLSYKFFNYNEWANRFWPALLGVLVVWATYSIGSFLKSQQTGFIASMMMSTSLLFYACSKILLLDMAVSSFITFALYSFLLSTSILISKQKKFIFNMSFFIFLALGCLSKGFIALILPYGIIFLWVLFTRNFKYFKQAFHPIGIILFSLIALPWHVLASIRNPEFFHFYFIHEHIERFLTTTHNRHEPVYYFFLVLILGLFPWFFIILELLCENFKKILKNDTELFFLLWFLLIFVFFFNLSIKDGPIYSSSYSTINFIRRI